MNNKTKNRFFSLGTKMALTYIVLLILVAVFADVFANADNGLIVKYGPNNIGTESNVFKPPGFMDIFRGSPRKHLLGTEGRGRDVASILIHGTRTSLVLGFFASLLAISFGTFLGILSSYYGNNSLKMHPLSILFFLLLGPLVIYYSSEMSYSFIDKKVEFNYLSFAIYVLLGLAALIVLIKKTMSFWSTRIEFPMDSIVMRFTEIFRAVPKLFLLLSLISFVRSQNLWSTAFLLGALGWPRILRLVRGEVMDIKKETYIINARLIGLSDFKIIWRHILPNILPLLLVSMAFLISGNILFESTLSFLGLGLPPDQPSWGGLLRQSREDFGAWWLAVFPGLTITLTLFSLNILAENYNNYTKKTI